MQAVTERRHISLSMPDLSKSGYLGTLEFTDTQLELAKVVAGQRQKIAATGDFQKVKKLAGPQWLNDLKGAMAEIGFGDYLALVADLNGVNYELAELVSDKPVEKQDITLDGMKFDIKGCAGKVEGLTERDDKLLIISCTKHEKKYQDYQGYFWVKTYQDKQDVFYFTRAEVSTWKRMPGQFKASDYYALPVPALH